MVCEPCRLCRYRRCLIFLLGAVYSAECSIGTINRFYNFFLYLVGLLCELCFCVCVMKVWQYAHSENIAISEKVVSRKR